jgi:hypothetical protein
MEDVEDAYADMSEPPPPTPRARKNDSSIYAKVYGIDGLNTYLVERRAEIVLPLLLAMQRRLAMTTKAVITLSSKVWKDAGNPSKNRRVAIVSHLRRMPDLVVIHEVRRFTSRYRLERGPAWKRIEKDGQEGVAVKWEEEDEDI